MPVKMGRILITAIAVEVIAIIGLVLVTAVLGPSDPEAARVYAERVGYWFGPVAGFVLCVVGGWFVTRRMSEHHILNGFALGAAVAAIDIALILVSGVAFQLIFVVSNIGRLIAGTIGGWLASRGTGGAA